MPNTSKNKKSKRGRPSVDPVYVRKTLEIQFKYELQNQPKEVRKHLQTWHDNKQNSLPFVQRQKGIAPYLQRGKYSPVPHVITVGKIMMKKVGVSVKLQEDFQYPRDMSAINEKDPRVPLMAQARDSDLTDERARRTELSQIAVYAEVYWCSELMEALGEESLDLAIAEMRLAWKRWRIAENSDELFFYKKECRRRSLPIDGPIIDTKRYQWLLTSDMPSLLNMYSENRRVETTGKNMNDDITIEFDKRKS